jgi:hypothetical protein
MFVSYSDQMVPLRNQLLLGHAAEALPEVRDSTPGDDTYVLDQLEQGRIAWLASQDAASKQAFAAADSRLVGRQSGRVPGQPGLAQAAACSPMTRPWLIRAPDYERTMLHHYLALNYLQRGCRGRPGGGAPPTRCRSRPSNGGPTRCARQSRGEEEEAGRCAS